MNNSAIPPKANETDLIGKLREGSQEAFAELYHQYSPALYMNILKMVKDELVAEELIQELFTKIWQKRAELHIESDFLAYLYRVAQNLVRDFFRKLQRDKDMMAHFQQLATANYSGIEEALFYKESEHLLKMALEQLPAQQRRVYQLCKIDGFTYKQAAEEMHISAHTIKEYLSKASYTVKMYLLSNLDITISLLLFLSVLS